MREIKGVACCTPAFSDLLELKQLKNVEVVVERFWSLQILIAGNLMVHYYWCQQVINSLWIFGNMETFMHAYKLVYIPQFNELQRGSVQWKEIFSFHETKKMCGMYQSFC